MPNQIDFRKSSIDNTIDRLKLVLDDQAQSLIIPRKEILVRAYDAFAIYSSELFMRSWYLCVNTSSAKFVLPDTGYCVIDPSPLHPFISRPALGYSPHSVIYFPITEKLCLVSSPAMSSTVSTLDILRLSVQEISSDMEIRKINLHLAKFAHRHVYASTSNSLESLIKP